MPVTARGCFLPRKIEQASSWWLPSSAIKPAPVRL